MCILLVSIRNITYQMNHSHCYDFFFNLKTESKYHILQERQKLEYKARKKECQEWWKAMQARVKWQKNPTKNQDFWQEKCRKAP